MQTKFIVHLIGRISDKANRFLVQELRARKIEEIGPSHGDIIGLLCMEDQLPMRELATRIRRDKSTVTSLVNKLVRLGYVEKEKDPGDHRVTRVRLSEKGKSLKPEIVEIGRQLRARAYRNLSGPERRTLLELLTRVHESL